MNAIFLKLALILRTILAALGMGGCLNPQDVDTLEEVVDDFILVEETIEEVFEK